MKSLQIVCLLLPLAAGMAHAGNDTIDAALGGAVGGALGGAIGSEVGGREGAIIGAGVGAAAGTAITTRNEHYRDEYHEHHEQRDHSYERGPRYSEHRHSRPGSGYHEHGGFCPPGQAKKGRC